MQIKFSSKFIKITFEDNEPFCGKSIRIKGEPLVNGFDAALYTAEWLENHIGSPVKAEDLGSIKGAIQKNNDAGSFKVLFMGE